MTDTEIHPAPDEAQEHELLQHPILRFFHYQHLPLQLQERSAPFCALALKLVRTTVPSAELSAALRKLLEAKDAAIRAAL